MRFNPRYYFAALEAVYGTPEGLLPANAIRTTGIDPDWYAGNSISRELDSDTFGNSPIINTNPHNAVSFGVEMSGAGAAGDVPLFGVLLQACGLLETVNALVDVTYTVDRSAVAKSVTGLFSRPEGGGNSQEFLSAGVRGNMGITIANGQMPTINFDNMLGSYVDPESKLGIAPDWTGWQTPEPTTNANTPTATLDGYSLCLESLNFNLGNEITRVNAPGCEETMLGDLAPTAQAVFKAPTLAEKNFFQKLRSDLGVLSPVVLDFEHGSAAGRILQLLITSCQIASIKDTELRGELAYTVDLIPLDGISIIVK